MSSSTSIPFSVLDLAPVPDGSTAGDALRNSLDLARHVERLGYPRYWVAEHHNMPGIASSSPAVLIGHLAAVTSTMRVGSGGVMLPNHAPLVVAEQFGMLEAFHPGRIDLGIGRAPGHRSADRRRLAPHPAHLRRRPSRATSASCSLLRQRGASSEDPFGHAITAVPGRGNVPAFWLLGSSDYSAQVAGYLGLPFAFAHHFSARQHAARARGVPPDVPPARRAGGAATPWSARRRLRRNRRRGRLAGVAGALSFLRLRSGRPGLLPTPKKPPPTRTTRPNSAFIAQRQKHQIIGLSATVAPDCPRCWIEPGRRADADHGRP